MSSHPTMGSVSAQLQVQYGCCVPTHAPYRRRVGCCGLLLYRTFHLAFAAVFVVVLMRMRWALGAEWQYVHVANIGCSACTAAAALLYPGVLGALRPAVPTLFLWQYGVWLFWIRKTIRLSKTLSHRAAAQHVHVGLLTSTDAQLHVATRVVLLYSLSCLYLFAVVLGLVYWSYETSRRPRKGPRQPAAALTHPEDAAFDPEEEDTEHTSLLRNTLQTWPPS